MPDPRINVPRDFDLTVCPPSAGVPPPDPAFYTTTTDVQCAGLAAALIEAKGDLPEDITDDDCIARVAAYEADPRYEVKTVTGTDDCEECCCCPCPCCCGNGYWTEYTLTVAGVTDNTCDECDELNGTFTLKKREQLGAATCTWNTDEQSLMVTCAGGVGPIWTLACTEGEWELLTQEFVCGLKLFHTLDSMCLCGGTLPLDPDANSTFCPGIFCNHPGSLTVEPAGEWVSCGKAAPICGAFAAMMASETPEQKTVRAETHKARAAKTVGPGTELKKLLGGLGIVAATGCGCEDRAKQMNRWGVAGCKARRAEIVEWLRSEQAKRGWRDKLKAARLAVASGIAFKLNPRDPAPGLFDEAIRRASTSSPGSAGSPP